MMYKLKNYPFSSEIVPNIVFRVADGACIPFDPDNTDYQAFLKYQAEGGVVLPADTEQAKKDACKAKAKALLSQTDWAVLPDVGLANQDAFVFYRLNLRNLVINPVADAVFEAMPEPIWS